MLIKAKAVDNIVQLLYVLKCIGSVGGRHYSQHSSRMEDASSKIKFSVVLQVYVVSPQFSRRGACKFIIYI